MDRQDRYIVFKNCRQVADYFAAVIHCVAGHSFTLNDRGSTEKPSAITEDPLASKQAARKFRTSLKQAVEEITLDRFSDAAIENDTTVYPLIQMGYYDIRQDELVSQKLLEELKRGERLFLASGYFNLPPQYINAILGAGGKCEILAASPQVINIALTRVSCISKCTLLFFSFSFLCFSSFLCSRPTGFTERQEWLDMCRTCTSTLPGTFWSR